MIETGQSIPDLPTRLVSGGEIEETSTHTVLGDGCVVLFTVPGAFTPTCHQQHLTSFVDNASKLRAAGVDRIVCASVNDAHVLKAWAQASDASDIAFLADGNAELAEATGLARDMSTGGMGTRFTRAAMILEDGVVKHLFVEEARGVTGSGAQAILIALEAARA
ncbi:peroxiredoxin [Devosia pacifica]|uniref:Glutathione-dependent peroxiredoxin n=1 Tax=Devosia pacifica TaxID=1335967 RepID=A0A918VWP6_9HYPH|nr:peroxiredoxin [Devosia pacifica]GHA30538.1 peroxiredoxin [Devosia pacifica]